jgi:hypothetical protein
MRVIKKVENCVQHLSLFIQYDSNNDGTRCSYQTDCDDEEIPFKFTRGRGARCSPPVFKHK